MQHNNESEIPFGVNLAPIRHSGTNPQQQPQDNELYGNSGSNGRTNEAGSNVSNPQDTQSNDQDIPRLHHYIYTPSRQLLPEHIELCDKMNLTLDRIKGDIETPLHVPIKPLEVVNESRDKKGFFSLRLTALNDPSGRRGVYFDPMIRSVGPCSEILIGRFTKRLNNSISHFDESVKPCLLKSKVVSRTHACFRVDCYGNWYLKDLKSSSGTFLNHMRISPASSLSRDFLLKDGDTIQLGMDFRGGTEELYRSIKFRVGLNKSWKLKASKYNKQLMDKMKGGILKDQDDCSICLTKVKPCQPLFVSPCAHIWHYSCIRRMIVTSYPTFDCPNCRKRTDLEVSLESESEEEEEEIDELDQSELEDEMENSIDGSYVEEATEDDCVSDDINKETNMQALNQISHTGLSNSGNISSNVIINSIVEENMQDDDVDMQSLG